jgi:hypothetical protein
MRGCGGYTQSVGGYTQSGAIGAAQETENRLLHAH